MIKKDLIEAIARKTGVQQKEIDRVMTALAEVVTEATAAGEPVTLTGIGVIKPSTRAARTGRNPKTGEALEIPAKHTVKFSPAKALADAAGARK